MKPITAAYLDSYSRYRLIILVAVCIVAQLPGLIWGFEVSDLGFYMTFYQNFIDAPADVSYNFMYWLTGLIGYGWCSVFGFGAFPIRVLGLICNTISALALYRMYPGCDQFKIVICTVLCVLFGYFAAPLAFYYDILSTMLCMLGLLCMFRGLEQKEARLKVGIYVFVSGLIFGLNVYSRITNIAGILFVLLIPIYWFYRRDIKAGRLMMTWLGGWLVSIGGVIMLMDAMGHLEIFIDTVSLLFGVAASDASHGMGNIVGNYIGSWLEVIKMTLKLLILLVIPIVVGRFKSARRWGVAAWILIGAMFAIVTWRTGVDRELYAVSVTGLLISLALDRCPAGSLRAWGGLMMLTLLPAGSDYGLFNIGTIVLWLPLAVSFAYFAKSASTEWRGLKLTAGFSAVSGITLITIVISVIGLFTRGVYFDSAPITEMRTPLEHIGTKGILTTKHRAEIADRILWGVDTVVERGDRMLVYGNAPGFNWLTETRPVMGCSWPEQLSDEMFASNLDTVRGDIKILMLNFETLGGRWGDPERGERGERGEIVNRYRTPGKTQALRDYIRRKQFKELSGDEYYTLYGIPERDITTEDGEIWGE